MTNPTMTGSPFEGRPVIAVIRHGDPSVAAEIARAAVTVLPAVEVTLTVPGSSTLIATIRSHRRVLDGDTAVGAGTVLTAGAAHEAIAAGATFIVSPTFDADVAAVAADAGIAYIPGTFTPTEVRAAVKSGSGVVKLFPATVLGPPFLRAVSDVFPDVRFVPTGGIGAENVSAWIAAGAHAVGVGGSLNAAYERGGVDAVITEATTLAALASTTSRTRARSTANGATA